MPIRLMENFRALFYAPYYATLLSGFYARESVEVELVNSDAPGDAVPKLMDGSIDITWGGPMRVMRACDQDQSSPLVSFCEVVSHDPFFLIGKPGAKPFRLADLPDKKFASVSEVPTPWMCLQQDLRDAGLDPNALARVSDRTMAQNYEALRRGEIEVMQAFEPFASMAEHDRVGEVLYAATTRGPTAYTAFIATREACERRREEFKAMSRATANMLGWLYESAAEELALVVADLFPDVPIEVLESSMRRYRDGELWSRQPTMSRQGFDRLGVSLLSGGLIARAPKYEICVETTLNGPAQWAAGAAAAGHTTH
jgi:NitT/TauT family transport system substrate-binding protein